MQVFAVEIEQFSPQIKDLPPPLNSKNNSIGVTLKPERTSNSLMRFQTYVCFSELLRTELLLFRITEYFFWYNRTKKWYWCIVL